MADTGYALSGLDTAVAAARAARITDSWLARTDPPAPADPARVTFAVGTWPDDPAASPTITWTPAGRARHADSSVLALHAGRLSGEPDTAGLTAMLVAARRSRAVTIALSLRPTPPQEPEPDGWRSLLCRQISQAHIVITSQADLGRLYPGVKPATVAAFWRGTGADCWIVTGSHSALLIAPNGVTYRRTVPESVTTTPAGVEAFTQGILAGFGAAGAYGDDPAARITALGTQQWLTILHHADLAVQARVSP